MLVIVFSVILVIGMIITASCYGHLIRTYKKYSLIESKINVQAINFIDKCIKYFGLQTKIALIDGELNDAYLIKKDIIVLSEGVARGRSVADISVASHELGHAMQKQDSSAWLSVDMLFGFLNRVANFFLPIALLTALIFVFFAETRDYALTTFYISVALWFVTFLFKLITIPLELDASKRAYKILSDNKIFNKEELKGCKKVLNAAALTYVGSLFIGFYKAILVFKRAFRRD